MVKIGFFLIAVLLILSSCGVSKNSAKDLSNDTLTYSITPILKGDQPHIEVSFQAIADANGHIQLGYPDTDWGEINLFNSLKEFKVFPEAKNEIQKDRNQIYIWGKPNKTYTFSYKIIQDFKDSPKSETTYRPIVSKDYFHVIGKNLLILPLGYFGSEDVSCDLKIKWKYPKRGFSIVNSFGSDKEQNIHATYHELYSSIFIGGKINSLESEILGNKIVFATTDKWDNIDIEKASEDLSKIIQQQRDFWNDHTTKLQTVTLIKTFEDCPNEASCSNSISGTALTNSFATFCSDNWMSSNNRMNWLFAHELFHNWVGNTIRNESEEKEYWFSEGFTDYYAYKLLMRSEMMDNITFIDKVNSEVIEPHYTAPNKNSPNDEIDAEKFWTERIWEKLPYRRGWLYAFYLDCKIKNLKTGKSLDDVMYSILNSAKNENLAFNQEVFLQAIEPFLDDDFRGEFHDFIELGTPIDLTKMNVPGIYFEEGEVPTMRINNDFDPNELIDFMKL